MKEHNNVYTAYDWPVVSVWFTAKLNNVSLRQTGVNGRLWIKPATRAMTIIWCFLETRRNHWIKVNFKRRSYFFFSPKFFRTFSKVRLFSFMNMIYFDMIITSHKFQAPSCPALYQLWFYTYFSCYFYSNYTNYPILQCSIGLCVFDYYVRYSYAKMTSI